MPWLWTVDLMHEFTEDIVLPKTKKWSILGLLRQMCSQGHYVCVRDLSLSARQPNQSKTCSKRPVRDRNAIRCRTQYLAVYGKSLGMVFTS